MLIYASQIKEGDRFHFRIDDYHKLQGGRVQSDKGWVYVVCSFRERSRTDDVDVRVTLITQFDQRLHTTLPVTLTIDVTPEGGVEYMAMYGNVWRRTL